MDVWLVLLLVLAAEFVNGWTDAPNAIATVVSTRVMSPQRAVLMATVLNVLGTMSGTAVAVTIGTGIVDPKVIDLVTVAAAMVGIYPGALWPGTTVFPQAKAMPWWQVSLGRAWLWLGLTLSCGMGGEKFSSVSVFPASWASGPAFFSLARSITCSCTVRREWFDPSSADCKFFPP